MRPARISAWTRLGELQIENISSCATLVVGSSLLIARELQERLVLFVQPSSCRGQTVFDALHVDSADVPLRHRPLRFPMTYDQEKKTWRSPAERLPRRHHLSEDVRWQTDGRAASRFS